MVVCVHRRPAACHTSIPLVYTYTSLGLIRTRILKFDRHIRHVTKLRSGTKLSIVTVVRFRLFPSIPCSLFVYFLQTQLRHEFLKLGDWSFYARLLRSGESMPGKGSVWTSRARGWACRSYSSFFPILFQNGKNYISRSQQALTLFIRNSSPNLVI